MLEIICGSEPKKAIATGLKHCPKCGDVLTYFGHFLALLREGSVNRGHNFYPDRPGACPLCSCENPPERKAEPPRRSPYNVE